MWDVFPPRLAPNTDNNCLALESPRVSARYTIVSSSLLRAPSLALSCQVRARLADFAAQAAALAQPRTAASKPNPAEENSGGNSGGGSDDDGGGGPEDETSVSPPPSVTGQQPSEDGVSDAGEGGQGDGSVDEGNDDGGGGLADAGVVEDCAEDDPEGDDAADVADGPAGPVAAAAPEAPAGPEVGAEGADDDDGDIECSPTPPNTEGSVSTNLGDITGADETDCGPFRPQESPTSGNADSSSSRGDDEPESGVEEIPVGLGDGAGVVDV